MKKFYRDRASLVPGDLMPGPEWHDTDNIDVENCLRTYAGQYVAAVHTAAGNAHYDTCCFLAGFGTRDAAERAVAEVISARLKTFGKNILPGEVLELGRRSWSRRPTEWGGPPRPFQRISLFLHFGRVYSPLKPEEQAKDRNAYEAYMAMKAEEEAIAKARAEEAKAKMLSEHQSQPRAVHDRKPPEIEDRETREDRELISRLVFRAQDRRFTGLRYKVDWAPINRQLARCGVWSEIHSALDALVTTDKYWFIARCRVYGQRAAELNNLRNKIRKAAFRELEIASFYRRLPEITRKWAEAYVARRRERLDSIAA